MISTLFYLKIFRNMSNNVLFTKRNSIKNKISLTFDHTNKGGIFVNV